MSSNIFNHIKNKALTTTPKGNLAYVSTGNANVDFFLAGYKQSNILQLFTDALDQDSNRAFANLLYLLDRHGKGQRDNFATIWKHLMVASPKVAVQFFSLIAIYGRYDLILAAFDNEHFSKLALSTIKMFLANDYQKMQQGKSISLLAKWLPSHRANKKNSPIAKKIWQYLATTQQMGNIIYDERSYRQTLAKMRSYSNVFESYLSHQADYDFNHLTSANHSFYRNVFNNKDHFYYKGYQNWLASRKSIKSEHFNFAQIITNFIDEKVRDENAKFSPEVAMQIDKAFVDYLNNIDLPNRKPLIILDTSGSMRSHNAIGNALLLTYGLAHASGNQKFITFSDKATVQNYFASQSLSQNLASFKFENRNTHFHKIIEIMHQRNDLMEEFDSVIILTDQKYDTTLYYDREFEAWMKKLGKPTLYIDVNPSTKFFQFRAIVKNVAVVNGKQNIINNLVACGGDLATFMDESLAKYAKVAQSLTAVYEQNKDYHFVFSTVKKPKRSPQVSKSKYQLQGQSTYFKAQRHTKAEQSIYQNLQKPFAHKKHLNFKRQK